MKKIIALSLVLFLAISGSAQSPKYIFYFIGDGMGFNHVALARGAASAKDSTIEFKHLSFTQFPVVGMVRTFAGDRLTTCSAAAGTALATGHKTSIGTIGMDVDHKNNLESVAVVAKKAGMKAGVITTVSIDHATPAAFYAHAKSRSKYDVIASWIVKAGLDLYAGSGLLKITENFYDSISKNYNFNVCRGNEAKLIGQKLVWIENQGKKVDALSLAIDRQKGDMNLPDMVEKSIEFLDNKNGFFLMAEGGQIDWAAHANDAASIVCEVEDFSEAIGEAVDFYNEHPNETLIVITADHETGGLALGRDDRGYDTNLELLYTQGGSKNVVGKDKCELINKSAGVGFTTGAHTAAFVPVYAIGVGCEKFRGELNNIDIPRLMIELIKADKK